MHIELIKFYEIARTDEKQHLIGSLHIRLPEIGLHIKGIIVFRKKQYWYFRLPSRKAFDQNLGKEVDYACILFDEREKNQALLSFLKTEGRAFVENYLTSTPEIPKLQPAPKPAKSKAQSDCASVTEKSKGDALKTAKPLESLPLPQPIAKMAAMDFTDPPKRPALAKGSKFARR